MSIEAKQTLEDKITTLVEHLRDLNKAIEAIHMDFEHTNKESAQHTELVRQHMRVTAKIWNLKNNW